MEKQVTMPRRDAVRDAAFGLAEERGGTLEERKEYYALCISEWEALETWGKEKEA